MSFLSKPEIPPMPKAPDLDGPAMQEARDKQRRMIAGMEGRKSNMLTGPQGVTGAAPVAQKMLLGQ